MFRRTSISLIYAFILCLCSNYVFSAATVPERTSVSESKTTDFEHIVRRLLGSGILNSFLNNTNEDCRSQAASVLTAAKRLELWALKVADASATVPSGLLQGNVHQFGDIDECLSAISAANPSQTGVRTKYCLAAVDLTTIPYAPAGKLMRSLDIFRSNLSDPGHRVPRISAALIGLCIPKSCAPVDVENSVRSSLLPLSLDVRVEDALCRDEESSKIGLSFWFASGIFGLLLLCVVSSTIADVYFSYLLTRKCDGSQSDACARQPTLHESVEGCLRSQIGPLSNSKAQSAFLAFSIRNNWQKFISVEKLHGDIPCLHGIRAVHVLALLLSHKSVAILYSPYANRTDMAKITGASWGILGRAAILYTDTFILISGLLTAQSILRELNRTGRVQLIKRVLSRYMRLTPVLLAIILWCTLLLPKLSSGPLWGLVVEKHAELCKQYWPRNLFYIHNYYGFEDMCLTHTHQLGIDMQLFIFAPALVIPLWLYPRVGMAIMVSLAAASTFLRYVVTYNNELSSLVYFGVPISQMFKTAKLSYTLPTHRATVYIFGLVLGWGLSRLPRNYVVPVPVSILGWSFFGMLGVHALLGSYETALPEYVYNVSQAANYAAFAPVMWSAFLSWGIFACVHNAGGFLNKLFSWRWFVVVTRLAYSVYLTQFPVFFYNIGVKRHSTSYNGFELLNLPEFIFIFLVSGLLTLFVELPFQEISDIILKNRGITTENTVNNCSEKKVKGCDKSG